MGPEPFNAPRFTDSLKRAAGVGPALGSTIGAFAGGVPGAAIGGAAGEGFEQITRHAREIPGAVVDVARNLVQQPRATLRGAAEGVAQGVTDVATAAGLGGALEAGGQAAMKGLGSAAQAVYRGYLKPSLASKALGKADAVVKTALDEALPITAEGGAKAQRLISQINGQVKTILAKTPGTADLADLADQLRVWAAKQFYRPGVASSDYEAALKVADSIDKHASLTRAFHGSPHAFDAFSFAKAGTTTDAGFLGKGAYFSTDPVVAGNFANQYRATLKLEHPLTVELPSFATDKTALVRKALGLSATADADAIKNAAVAKGYDGVIVDYTPTGYKHQEIAVFNPENIAAFKNISTAGPKGLAGLDVPLTVAQETKQALQKGASAAYGTQSNATTTAQKVGARLIRKDIESKAPVAALNASESRLIDTAKAIARAVQREKNQYTLTGTKSMIAGVVGGEEYQRTGDPWTAAAKALALRYALKPAVASRLAIVAYRIGKLPGIAPASAARLALAALSETGAEEGP